MSEDIPAREVGVGPHPKPWPDDPRLDSELLASGDRRNVVDSYRYWATESIVADLDRRRHAYLAAEIHIIGRRRWNRRGAMVTDRYQHVRHHATTEAFVAWADGEQLPMIGIDILPDSTPLETAVLPERCVLVFGQEGPGLSDAVRDACEKVCSIAQFGSTRSINAGVASGIAMHAWIRQHVSFDA